MAVRAIAAASLAALVPLTVNAQEQEGPLTLGAGLHYSTGNYGTSTTTEITTLAFTAKYQTGNWTLRAFVPYLEVTGDSSVIPGIGRVRGGGDTTTQTGIGDIVLGATYTALADRAGSIGLDLTGKVKVATADENKGLGTGEHDFAFLAEIYKTVDRVTPFFGVGYHVLGDAPGQPFDNVWSMSFGASYKIDERTDLGAAFDTRDRVVPGGSPQRELIGFFTRKLTGSWKAQVYGLIGLADGSPDWGLGATLAHPF